MSFLGNLAKSLTPGNRQPSPHHHQETSIIIVFSYLHRSLSLNKQNIMTNHLILNDPACHQIVVVILMLLMIEYHNSIQPRSYLHRIRLTSAHTSSWIKLSCIHCAKKSIVLTGWAAPCSIGKEEARTATAPQSWRQIGIFVVLHRQYFGNQVDLHDLWNYTQHMQLRDQRNVDLCMQQSWDASNGPRSISQSR